MAFPNENTNPTVHPSIREQYLANRRHFEVRGSFLHRRVAIEYEGHSYYVESTCRFLTNYCVPPGLLFTGRPGYYTTPWIYEVVTIPQWRHLSFFFSMEADNYLHLYGISPYCEAIVCTDTNFYDVIDPRNFVK